MQLHFHSAAEHSFSGGLADMELHIVHANKDDANDLMVIGVQLQAQVGILLLA